jgi:8-oxo-dGTP diphosphatase
VVRREPSTSVAAFLAGLVPACREEIVWRRKDPQPVRLEASTFLTRRRPPSAGVSSARAIVLVGEQVVVVRDPESVHVIPGGRLEAGETPARAARREALEETGWRLGRLRYLGFRHLRSLAPPGDPTFEVLQAVYVGAGLSQDEGARDREGYELGWQLVPVGEALALPLTGGERALLRAAAGALTRP